MNLPGITWRGGSVEDFEILGQLPTDLANVLHDSNGFMVHEGSLHVRGAVVSPEWHSLRAAWSGPNSFSRLYPEVRSSDVPFAQDQFGDQFLIREGAIVRLFAETGQIEPLAASLPDFFQQASRDIHKFLNVGLNHKLPPGQLIFAYPPFCLRESGAKASLNHAPVSEVIALHAELAGKLRDLPDGGQIQFNVTD